MGLNHALSGEPCAVKIITVICRWERLPVLRCQLNPDCITVRGSRMERPSIISLSLSLSYHPSFLVHFLSRLNTIKRGKRLYSLNAKQGTWRMQICNFFPFFLFFSFFLFFEIIQGRIQRKEGRKAIEKRFNKCANVPFSTNISIPITAFWRRPSLWRLSWRDLSHR